MFVIMLRTLIIYIVLLLAIKLSGKRQVGEMQPSELINAFLISEVASAPLSDPDIPIIYAAVPILLLSSLEILISYITIKSVFFKKLFESPPTVIISNGKLNSHSLDKQRMSIDELISSLRQKDISDISNLEFCFLEHNGQISAFTKDDNITLPVIIDGKANYHYLKLLNKDKNWLMKKLSQDKKQIDNIFLMTTDGQDAKYIEKEKKQ